MFKFMQHFACRDDGATAIEYALIAGLIFLAIAGTVHQLGDKLNSLYLTIANVIP